MEIEDMGILFAKEVYKKFLYKSYYLKPDYSEDLISELILRLEVKNYKNNERCQERTV